MNSPIVAACVFMPLFATLIGSFVMFDRLIRAEYEQHHAAWQNDGRPTGFFWTAPECGYFRSVFARNSATVLWLFVTPSWVSRSVELQPLLRHYRVAMGLYFLQCAGLIVLVLTA